MRRLIALAACCAAVAGLAACGSDDSSDGGSGGTTAADPVKVGVVLKSLQNDYWLLGRAGVDQAIAALGDTAEVEFAAGTDQNDATEQISLVENMLTKGVRAIAIAPSGSGQLTPALERAIGEGVPVILIDTDLPELSERSFVGTDNVAGGELAGRAFLEALGGRTGKVVVMTALRGTQSVDDREKGFRQALEGSGNTIVQTAQTRCDPAVSKGIAENVLTKDPDVVGFFSPCGGILDGVIAAATEAGGAEKAREMAMFEFDFAMSFQGDILRNGMLDGTVAQYPQDMGKQATELAARAAAGEEIPAVVATETAIVTPENYRRYAEEFDAALATVDR
jgi:ribose transport system substrate-binding protein